MAQFIADRIVRRHLETMARLNIGYDLLTWEGDILRLHFWTHAFEFLKKTGAVFLQTEGKLKGCWVMRIEDDEAGGQQEAAEEEEEEAEQREKVIVRSDGTVTYVGKDMAYQLWKFGLLGRDFYYRLFAHQSSGTPLWSHVVDAVRRQAGAPSFGRASWVCNVIDTRQSYLQKLVKQALGRARLPRAGVTLGPLLVRDGGAVAFDRARARLRHECGRAIGRSSRSPAARVSG